MHAQVYVHSSSTTGFAWQGPTALQAVTALWAGISAHAAQSQTCTADLKVTELALQTNIALLQPAAHTCTSVCAQLQAPQALLGKGQQPCRQSLHSGLALALMLLSLKLALQTQR